MLTFTLPLFSMVLFFGSTTTTTTEKAYNAIDCVFLDCGSSSTTISDRRWDGDGHSKFVSSNTINTSFLSKPYSYVTPYSSARIFPTSSTPSNSSFTYNFPVSEGPKFLRLYFYPATYSNLNPNQSYFSVSSNGFSLLTNFSPFLTASYLATTQSNGGVGVPNFVKEYIIYVKDTPILNVTFTPEPNSYAFINGIEIVSMPEDLYFNSKGQKAVGMVGPAISTDMALENIYRLNMGGGYITGTEDTGLYRSWEPDILYLYGAALGNTPEYDKMKKITYTKETPNYTAPELVYRTQRSMGKLSDQYNLTYILAVDSGYYYNIRLHFCNIIPLYNKSSQMVFKIFINNQTADDEIDLFYLTQGSGYPVFNDYVVFVNDTDGSRGKQDLWVALHPNPSSKLYQDAYLNGLEAFKLSMDGNLGSPNPELSSTSTPPTSVKRNKKKPQYAMIIGSVGGAVVLFILVLRVYRLVELFKISYSSISN